MIQMNEDKNKVLDFLNEKIDSGFMLVDHIPLSIDGKFYTSYLSYASNIKVIYILIPLIEMPKNEKILKDILVFNNWNCGYFVPYQYEKEKLIICNPSKEICFFDNIE